MLPITLEVLVERLESYHREVSGWREETKKLLDDHEKRIRIIEDSKRSSLSNGNGGRYQRVKEKVPPYAAGGGVVAVIILLLERLLPSAG